MKSPAVVKAEGEQTPIDQRLALAKYFAAVELASKRYPKGSEWMKEALEEAAWKNAGIKLAALTMEEVEAALKAIAAMAA